MAPTNRPPVTNDDSNATAPGKRRPIRVEESVGLARAISDCANRGLPRIDFMREVSALLLDFCGCDAIEVRLHDGDLHYRWEATRRPTQNMRFEHVKWAVAGDGRVIPALAESSDLERLCRDVACRRFDSVQPFFTSNGSFWTGNTWEPFAPVVQAGETPNSEPRCVGGHYRSLVVIRFFVDDKTVGLLHLKSEQPDYFTEDEVDFYERIAQTFGLAVASRRAEAALRERIKELTCLYGIAQAATQTETSLAEALQQVVELLPPAWQYPENTAARLTLDGRAYVTPRFRQSRYRLSAEIIVGDLRRGAVEVVYLEQRPELEAGVFLKEEEKLIDAVANEVAVIVERKEAAEEKSKLRHQLAHADRLATIGQLAAGVAHELNEPLSSILGFAQLAQDSPDLPAQVGDDIQKVVTASLYAREVIRKLMVFARQVAPQKTQVNLNQVVDDALHFLEGRCTKAGIRVIREFGAGLPEVTADPAQCKQVLVNLIVNAVQAMPDGGTLTVTTRADEAAAVLVVQDTGPGMDEEVLEKIFLPFFTTKDVDEGTGLGLAVAHGIVTLHGGSIEVESQPGRGARFVIRVPASEADDVREVPRDGI
ncbi:MAG: sensor histidine kinase [Planctomycetota bacterium]|jgi:signal transduction histidine kinase